MVADKAVIDERVSLRPVEDGDREFLLDVYAAGREIELAAVPWDDAMKRSFVEHQYTAQDAFYRGEYHGSMQHVIVFEGEPAGRLYLHRNPDEIAILDMAVLRQFRRKGIATAIVKRLQSEAEAHGVSVRIFIETFNPAGSLFSKLGFDVTDHDEVSRRYTWRRGLG
jgi:GNAT superfamily N-acetyltransferase